MSFGCDKYITYDDIHPFTKNLEEVGLSSISLYGYKKLTEYIFPGDVIVTIVSFEEPGVWAISTRKSDGPITPFKTTNELAIRAMIRNLAEITTKGRV